MLLGGWRWSYRGVPDSLVQRPQHLTLEGTREEDWFPVKEEKEALLACSFSSDTTTRELFHFTLESLGRMNKSYKWS